MNRSWIWVLFEKNTLCNSNMLVGSNFSSCSKFHQISCLPLQGAVWLGCSSFLTHISHNFFAECWCSAELTPDAVEPWYWALCRRRGDFVLTFTILGCREPCLAVTEHWDLGIAEAPQSDADLPKRHSPFLLETVYEEPKFWAQLKLCVCTQHSEQTWTFDWFLFGFPKSQDSVAQSVPLFSLPSCWQLGGVTAELVAESSVGCAQEGELEGVSPWVKEPLCPSHWTLIWVTWKHG